MLIQQLHVDRPFLNGLVCAIVRFDYHMPNKQWVGDCTGRHNAMFSTAAAGPCVGIPFSVTMRRHRSPDIMGLVLQYGLLLSVGKLQVVQEDSRNYKYQ